MPPDRYRFGIEIEIIADPHKVRSPLVAAEYRQRLAASLIKRGLPAEADESSDRYRKHPEEYPKRWWITKDGSLHNLSHPEIALEAVSPILSTHGDWELTIEKFWNAQKAVFHMPKRQQNCSTHIHIAPGRNDGWTMKQLKDIAIGIIVYEAELSQLLPSWKRNSAYCKRNTSSSSKLSSLPSRKAYRRIELSSRLSGVTSASELCDFMQADRYVLWNFSNICRGSSGTIEFRGGRGLRGPYRTKRWIAFTITFLDFLLHEHLDSENNNPSASTVEELYSKVREAADRHAMRQYLPLNYRVLNESEHDDYVENYSVSSDNVEDYGFILHGIQPIALEPRDEDQYSFCASLSSATLPGQ